MTLAEIIRETGELGVRRPELESDYKRIVLRAIKDIHLSRNWTWMRTTLTASISAGSSSATLSGYRGLDNEAAAAVTTTDENSNAIPVRVLTQGELEQLRAMGLTNFLATYSTYAGQYDPVYILTNSTGATLNILRPSEGARSYSVKCFAVPADLTAAQSNTLTNDHPAMVIALAKQYCWETLMGSPNCPDAMALAAAQRQIYQNLRRSAVHSDALLRLNHLPVRL